jgi:hypothetical protein
MASHSKAILVLLVIVCWAAMLRPGEIWLFVLFAQFNVLFVFLEFIYIHRHWHVQVWQG